MIPSFNGGTWDCDGLDPFRDDPVGNAVENLLAHQSTESEMKKTDRVWRRRRRRRGRTRR